MHNNKREDDGFPSDIAYLIYELIFRVSRGDDRTPHLPSFGSIKAGEAQEFGKLVADVLNQRNKKEENVSN